MLRQAGPRPQTATRIAGTKMHDNEIKPTLAMKIQSKHTYIPALKTCYIQGVPTKRG